MRWGDRHTYAALRPARAPNGPRTTANSPAARAAIRPTLAGREARAKEAKLDRH